MSDTDREKWNGKYEQCDPSKSIEPDEWLVEVFGQIEYSAAPRALELACGLGHNAIWLAQQNWTVDAVDISCTGLRIARCTADAAGVAVNWLEADLDAWQPTRHYDLVIVFRFLDRHSIPRIVDAAVRKDGWLVYETFSAAQLGRPDSHIRNPDFVLGDGELEVLFPTFQVVAQRTDSLSDRAVTRFLGRQKPKTNG